MVAPTKRSGATGVAAASLGQLAHASLARAAFAVECVAIAIALGLLLTFFVVRSDWLGTAHEWGLFLTHYADATPAARRPVNEILLGSLALLTLFVGRCRLAAARMIWRAQDAAAPGGLWRAF